MANKSKTYLLPYINDYIPIKHIKNLENTYLFFEKEYKICLLYKFSGKKTFIDYENEIMGNEYFDRVIDIMPDKVLYVLDMPEDLFKIIDLFLEGKYSYLPDKDKVKDFLKVNFGVSAEHKIFHILDRSETLKKSLEEALKVVIPKGLDLSDPPLVETEEFNI